jgi:hypothetical protein
MLKFLTFSALSVMYFTATILTSLEASAACGNLGICKKTIIFSGRSVYQGGSGHGASSRYWIYFKDEDSIFYTFVTDGKNYGSICSKNGTTNSHTCPGPSCNLEKNHLRTWASADKHNSHNETICSFNSAGNEIVITERNSYSQNFLAMPQNNVRGTSVSTTVVNLDNSACSVRVSTTLANYHSGGGPFPGAFELVSTQCSVRNGNQIPR